MDTQMFRAMIAELLGTFTLVFVGVAAAAVAGSQGVIVAALGHGLILIGLIYAYGHISGAHFNPAVTLALLLGGQVSPSTAALYMFNQFIGGIGAAVLARGLLPIGEGGQTVGSLTADAVWSAAGVEVILTFFLVSAVYQAAVAIGMTLCGAILAGGVFTGASLNPARTLGPALANADFSYLLPYLVGTFGGGALGGLVHGVVLRAEPA